MLHSRKCWANHMGYWAVDPEWFMRMFEAFRAGTLPIVEAKAQPSYSGPSYDVVDGVAIIDIVGQMMKGESKYGGASTVAARANLRAAVKDNSVKSVVLYIDSPGGTVAGTFELGQAIKEADKTKPVVAHIEDLGASAAYWVASQARKVYATETSQIGSIGVYTYVYDASQSYESQGVKVHVISTGGIKGAMVDGAPVTDEQIAEVQETVNTYGNHFVNAVAFGRGMSTADVRKLADGRMHDARKAQNLGLIDGIRSYEQTVESMASKRAPARRAKALAIEMEMSK